MNDSNPMRVSLFVSCLVDQMWPQAGLATARLLRRLGCDVHFDARQTCCGQPAFNSGYRREARDVASVLLDVFEDTDDPIVVPSGSCAAMIHHLSELWPANDSRHDRARALASRTRELSTFLVDDLDAGDVGSTFEGRVTWHDACHGLRDLGIHEAPRRLLSNVRGLELVEMDSSDSCCGFGGTFSVKYPEISAAMLDTKYRELASADVDAIVSGDASCLMQIGGRLAKTKESGATEIPTLHLAEVLATGMSS